MGRDPYKVEEERGEEWRLVLNSFERPGFCILHSSSHGTSWYPSENWRILGVSATIVADNLCRLAASRDSIYDLQSQPFPRIQDQNPRDLFPPQY